MLLQADKALSRNRTLKRTADEAVSELIEKAMFEYFSIIIIPYNYTVYNIEARNVREITPEKYSRMLISRIRTYLPKTEVIFANPPKLREISSLEIYVLYGNYVTILHPHTTGGGDFPLDNGQETCPTRVRRVNRAERDSAEGLGQCKEKVHAH